MISEDIERRVERAVEDWLQADREEIAQFGDTDIHIDDLLGLGTTGVWNPYLDHLTRTEAVNTAIASFGILVQKLDQDGVPWQPGLVIPLVSECGLLEMPPPPSPAALAQRLDDLIPPYLVLRSWDECRRMVSNFEEYRRPLTFSLISAPGVNVYYAEFRDEARMQADLPVSRSVFAKYYPLSHT